MTRREAREHCFKMLFCQDFYPAEEKEAQLEQYFEAPEEEESGEMGKEEILHQVEMGEEDRKMLEERVERIMARIGKDAPSFVNGILARLVDKE